MSNREREQVVEYREAGRVHPRNDPLRHGFAVPPLPKGRGFGKDGKFTAYRLTSSSR